MEGSKKRKGAKMGKKTIRQYLAELAVGELVVFKFAEAPTNKLKRVRRILRHQCNMTFTTKRLENIGLIMIIRNT